MFFFFDVLKIFRQYFSNPALELKRKKITRGQKSKLLKIPYVYTKHNSTIILDQVFWENRKIFLKGFCSLILWGQWFLLKYFA